MIPGCVGRAGDDDEGAAPSDGKVLVKMHDDQVHIDAAVVEGLLAEQFPALTGLPITRLRSTGTVNAIYRIGDELCARLPLVATHAASLEREARWLPWLAPRLPLPIPEPVGQGRPNDAYPLSWALYRWLDGAPYSDQDGGDEARAARDLAQFIQALRALEPSGAPAAGRRPLGELDTNTRAALQASGDRVDLDAACAAWSDALDTPAWRGRAVWIHADLLRPNVLARSGRIHAIIDFGSAGVGDPAADVIAAWSMFGPVGRAVFRSALSVDDETWRRARGFALHQAALAIPYYVETNPEFAALARRTVEQVLLDFAQAR
jgi:aminoglycoside phosphotransferase (APT) family kinase protein